MVRVRPFDSLTCAREQHSDKEEEGCSATAASAACIATASSAAHRALSVRPPVNVIGWKMGGEIGSVCGRVYVSKGLLASVVTVGWKLNVTYARTRGFRHPNDDACARTRQRHSTPSIRSRRGKCG